MLMKSVSILSFSKMWAGVGGDEVATKADHMDPNLLEKTVMNLLHCSTLPLCGHCMCEFGVYVGGKL